MNFSLRKLACPVKSHREPSELARSSGGDSSLRRTARLFGVFSRPSLVIQVSLRLSLLIFFLLITYHLSLITGFGNVHAQDAPSPIFCDGIETDKYTDNYVTNDDGEAPIVVEVSVTGNFGETKRIPLDEWFTVDFSKLQAIFGTTNSDYLEGKFQEEQHRTKNLLDLKSAAFNLFHGPGQKTTPKPLVDDLRIKYVDYVYNHPNLPEASFIYTDINGQNPKTIYELINDPDYQLPDLDPDTANPTPPSWGGNKDVWQKGWAKYWEKIPTAYSEFYTGLLEFRGIAGENLYTLVKEGKLCPGPTRTPIEFAMPEFFRTTSISDQLNQVVVPCAAQSWRHGVNDDKCGADITELENRYVNAQPGNFLSKTVSFCKNLITGPPKKLLKQLQRVIQTSFNFIQPLKDAYAADPPSANGTSCIKTLTPGKEGNAPYCALPATSLLEYGGEYCADKPSASNNKLDKDDNPRVICVFYAGTLNGTIDDETLDENSIWDSCTPNSGSTYTCTTTIQIWPVFRIPYLAEIWNNTMYSNEEEGVAGGGVGSRQESGRPGIYSNFTPKAIYAELFKNGGIINEEKIYELKEQCFASGDVFSEACDPLWAAYEALADAHPDIPESCPPVINDPNDLWRCFGAYWQRILSAKNLPGQAADNVAGAKTSVLGRTSGDAKDRFIGATDCNKFFTRDIALKPKALQEELGINSQECNLEAAAIPDGGNGDGGLPPDLLPGAPNLETLLNDAVSSVGIPLAMLKAIAKTETPGIFTFTDQEVTFFSTVNWWQTATNDQLLRGYAYDTCAQPGVNCGPCLGIETDVIGAFQFEKCTWSTLSSQIEGTLGHAPDRRNLQDTTTGAARHLLNLVTSLGSVPSGSWNEETVKKVAAIYCGYSYTDLSTWGDSSCTRYIDDTPYYYHDIVWDYYQALSNP